MAKRITICPQCKSSYIVWNFEWQQYECLDCGRGFSGTEVMARIITFPCPFCGRVLSTVCPRCDRRLGG